MPRKHGQNGATEKTRKRRKQRGYKKRGEAARAGLNGDGEEKR